MGNAVKTFKPIIDNKSCSICAVCIRGCPAEIIPAQRKETESLRGRLYQKYYPGVKATPQLNTEKSFGIPPCQSACPLQQDIREYVYLLAHRKYGEALETIRKTNALPWVTGYVCTHPCEMECLKCGVDEPISIKAMKRFVAERGYEGTVPDELAGREGKKVAIIGSGPAGLAAAYDLVREGHHPEIIEALPEPGGLLAWAIPPFRLPREILKRDINYIKKMGVTIKAGLKFGEDVTLPDLKKNGCEAVILAIGTHKALNMGIQNEDGGSGCVDCLFFLRSYIRGEPIKIGDYVIVIGGGYAAVDAARVAIRCGAKEVSIFYRRGPEEMPGKNEVSEGETDGVRIHYLTIPNKVIRENGEVKALELLRTKLGEADESGRRRPIPIQGSEFVVRASSIISAVGQQPDLSWNQEDLPFQLSHKDTFVVDGDGATNIEGIFAAGDAVSGPTTIVEAMASGRRAANAAGAYLLRKG